TVPPAVHVRVRGAVIIEDRVDHRLRLLCRSGVVEVDETVPVLLPLEQREVRATAGGVDHYALRPPRERSARRALTTRSSSSRSSVCAIRPRISAAKPSVSMPAAVSGERPRLRT